MAGQQAGALKRKRGGKTRLPGFYLYPGDWLSDTAVQRCSYAAQGLWINMLMRMHMAEPRGVLAGDLDRLAELFGMHGKARIAWVEDNAPHVSEIEGAGVFSRGDEFDSLPPTAIVNRRMYREFLQSVRLSEAGRKAANVRHGKTDEIMRSHAIGAAVDMRFGDVADRLQAAANERFATDDSKNGDAIDLRKSCLSLPNLTYKSKDQSGERRSDQGVQGDSRTPSRSPDSGPKRGGKPTSIEALLPTHTSRASGHGATAQQPPHDAEAPVRVVDELVALTGDGSFRKRGHAERVERIVSSPQGLNEIEDLLDRLRKDTDPQQAKARGNDCIANAARFANHCIVELSKRYGGES